MHKSKYLAVLFIFVMLFSMAQPGADAGARPLAATPTVGLGTAESFAVLAGAAVNDSVPSVISGDVGLSPSAWLSALTCLEVTGTIYSVDGSGPLPCRVTDAGLLTIAKNDLTTAYNDAAGRSASTIATQLDGQTLLDGVYDSSSGAFDLAVGGTLTLDGGGAADSVWIFKMESGLTTGSNSTVSLINGAQACNVFWQVGSSANLGTGTTFVGTIMADQSIADLGGSTVAGRFLARIAAVTLNDTTITRPFCAASGGGGGEGRRDRSRAVAGLPNTGGAPIRNTEFPWGLLIMGGITGGALTLAVRSSRRKNLSRK